MLVFLHATHFTQVLRLELELGGRTQNSHYAKIYQQVLSGGVKRRNQNQKFSFPFFAGSPHTPRRKRNCKEKFWFWCTRPQGACEARIVRFTTQSERTIQFQATTRAARAKSVRFWILFKMRSDFLVQREPVSMKPKIRLARSASKSGGSGGI